MTIKEKCFVLAFIDLTGNYLLNTSFISICLGETVLDKKDNRFKYEWRQICHEIVFQGSPREYFTARKVIKYKRWYCIIMKRSVP